MIVKIDMKKEKVLNNINPLFLKGICHRGLHNDIYTENGLNAFENALNHNMAIELDVHLTKDNQIVVIHDSELKRVTGKEGIVENLTLNELNEYKLLDGEKIPTLQEVFSLIQEKIPIVIELKVYNKNYKSLAKKVKEELKTIKDKKNIILISFDPRALLPFWDLGYIRQLLVANDGKHEYTYAFRHLFEGVDLQYTFLKHKKYQKYCKKHFSNVWTIENEEIVDLSLPYVDTITFQLMDHEYVKDKLTKKNNLKN